MNGGVKLERGSGTYTALSGDNIQFIQRSFPYVSIPTPSALVYSLIGTPPSATWPAIKDEEEVIPQVIVPLPDDVDPDCRIELKDRDGRMGLQIARCKGRTPKARIKLIHQEIEEAEEILFPPLQYVDRAVFPGETAHERPTAPMPNRYERITLGVLLSAIILKQRDWMKQLNEQMLHLWDYEHPVWTEWSKQPTAEPLWIVAVRRTLPDDKGRVHWIPEVELRFPPPSG